LCQRLRSSPAGLTREEAARRLQDFGLNLVARERKPTILQEVWGRARNPLNTLLLTLAAVSYFIGDMRAAIVIVLKAAPVKKGLPARGHSPGGRRTGQPDNFDCEIGNQRD
jgi:magnesium-transporting ATPase (P-type)